MQHDLDLSHLEPQGSDRVYDLIKKYWPVFDANGVFVSVKNYPKETPIMWKAIAALEKCGQIHQITDSHWLFRALLAHKPHQEHVGHINKFVWRFCANYIPLNSITQIIPYPIPWCDSVINKEFGLGVLYWLFDAPIGYHQLAIALASREKLAFQGPDSIKWTYCVSVMPYGPTNGPTTFIQFIHDVDSQWKALAVRLGLVIDNNTNTKIIVDDIFFGKMSQGGIAVNGMPASNA